MNLICLIVFVSVSVGMGLLAGSTVTLLSIIWRTCKVVGKCNIRDTIAVNNQDTRTFHLKGNEKVLMSYWLDASFFLLTYITVIVVTSVSVDSGVSVDVWTMCLFIVVFPLTSSTFLIWHNKKEVRNCFTGGLMSTFLNLSGSFRKWSDYWVMFFFFENHRMQWLSLCGWWARRKNL